MEGYSIGLGVLLLGLRYHGITGFGISRRHKKDAHDRVCIMPARQSGITMYSHKGALPLEKAFFIGDRCTRRDCGPGLAP
jgi:hypothetical protein